MQNIEDLTVLEIDPGPTPTRERMSLALLEAVRSDKLQQNADVVALYNGIEVAPNKPEQVDSLSVIHLGEHLDRLSAQALRKLDTQVPLETLRAVVRLALEIGREGREGQPVGTMLVVGDTRKVLTMSRPMNFNPFRGYSQGERDVRDRQVREQIKDLAKLEGRHPDPPRRRGRGRVHAHRGAGQGPDGEHGSGHPARRGGRHQRLHQGHCRRRQPVVGHRAPVPERRLRPAHRAAGPPGHLGPAPHGEPRAIHRLGHRPLKDGAVWRPVVPGGMIRRDFLVTPGTQAMSKALFTFVPLLVLAGLSGAADEDAKQIVIRWHGQSFFEIVSSQGTRIVLDPHAIEAYGRKVVQADVVLMSHLHDDHTQISVVENAKQAKVFNGLKGEKGAFRQEWNRINETIKGVRIRTIDGIGTYHDAMNGMQRGLNGVFILNVDGLRIVHLGDLGHTLSDAQLKKIGEVDILMIPVGGVYTLNGLDAQKVVEQIKPKRYIFPMHYGTLNYDYVLKPDTFLAEHKRENIRKLKVNEIKIDPKGAIPEEPLVIMLHWHGKANK